MKTYYVDHHPLPEKIDCLNCGSSWWECDVRSVWQPIPNNPMTGCCVTCVMTNKKMHPTIIVEEDHADSR